MLLIAIGSCALAALTTSKKPYPRTLQQAVLDSGGITVRKGGQDARTEWS